MLRQAEHSDARARERGARRRHHMHGQCGGGDSSSASCSSARFLPIPSSPAAQCRTHSACASFLNIRRSARPKFRPSSPAALDTLPPSMRSSARISRGRDRGSVSASSRAAASSSASSSVSPSCALEGRLAILLACLRRSRQALRCCLRCWYATGCARLAALRITPTALVSASAPPSRAPVTCARRHVEGSIHD